MRTTAPEPGFIPAYRIFMMIRLLFWVAVGPVLLLFELSGNPVLEVAAAAGRPLLPYFTLPYLAPLIAVDLLLLALLLWTGAPQRLGAWFVPATLVLGLLPLLVGYYRWPAENPLQSPFVMFFFVMALLIAWEYKYTYVSVYVTGLSFFQMAAAPPWPVSMPWTIPLGWLVLQAVMMLLAGYITATLVSVQARQRADLADAYERQAEANRRLQQYAAALEELATTRERNRLARELHDTLAHSLSALTVQLEAVRSLWATHPDRAHRILEQADATARTGLAEARRALRALRAAPLDEMGLALALRELAETAAQRTGARLEVHIPDSFVTCPSQEIEQGIYRVAQETLENVVRHAEAGQISVALEETKTLRGGDAEPAIECLVLTVRDDGLGLDSNAVDDTEEGAGERLGIRGMRERAALIGGELSITGAPGAGTTVVLTVPVERGTDGACADSGADL